MDPLSQSWKKHFEILQREKKQEEVPFCARTFLCAEDCSISDVAVVRDRAELSAKDDPHLSGESEESGRGASTSEVRDREESLRNCGPQRHVGAS
jgi:hypothetical protein